MINRGAILVRPKSPYVDWAATLEDPDPLPELDGEPTLYLIPAYDIQPQAEQLLQVAFPRIFEEELYAWCQDESTWPTDRTLPLFREWFEITFISVIEDLCGDPVVDEE